MPTTVTGNALPDGRDDSASHARARPLASERTSDDSLLFFLLRATRWRAIRAVTDARAPRAGARARTRRRVMRADTRRAGARGVDARAIRARANRSDGCGGFLFGGVFRRARSGRELRGRTRRRMPPRGRMGARARARRLISDAVSSKPEEGSRRSRIIDRCL